MRSLQLLLSFLFASVGTGFSPRHSFDRQLISATRMSSNTRLFSSWEEEEKKEDPSAHKVRFLGRGEHAVVRPGVVLLSPPDEFHHFLRQAAVFIYAMGEDDNDVYVIRGVILDHPTAFTLQEMMAADANEKYLQNVLYRGGEYGADSAFMLHSDDRLGQASNNEMIGTSGIFQGGMDYALSNKYSLDPGDVKFFFNYMEFTEGEMEAMLENREDETTQWVSVEVTPELILNSEYGRGEAWARLRNAVRER